VTPRGRPLRFLAVVTGGWIGVRIFLLWPADVAEVARVLVPPALAEQPRDRVRGLAQPRSAPQPRPIVRATMPPSRSLEPMPLLAEPGLTPEAAPFLLAPSAAPGVAAAPIVPRPPGMDHPPPPAPDRWSGSAWAILRPGGRATPFASQLGGSQAGARLSYRIGGGISAYARASAAIDSRQQEGALGLDWQPTRAPVHLIVERRIGIAGIPGGTAAGVIGGIGPTAIGHGLTAEAYGQGGVILRDRAEGFADGALRLTRTVGPIDLGIGAWGAAQRGAARLDLGPTLGAAIPVAGQRLRLSVDWRQRLAGDARPGSGPALSLGADF
jgi:hypothetical protein